MGGNVFGASVGLFTFKRSLDHVIHEDEPTRCCERFDVVHDANATALCFQRYRNILVFDCCAKSASLDQVAARYFDDRGKFRSCLVLARCMDEKSVVGASLDVHTSAWA